MLAAIFFVGWGLVGIFPLFMATIPSESVAREHSATVMGLCMGVPEVLGGALAPALAGFAADRTGSLATPLWIMFGDDHRRPAGLRHPRDGAARGGTAHCRRRAQARDVTSRVRISQRPAARRRDAPERAVPSRATAAPAGRPPGSAQP